MVVGSIAGRLETVWELLTSEAGSRRWLAATASGRLRVGALIQVAGHEGTVLELRPDDHSMTFGFHPDRQATLTFREEPVVGERARWIVKVEASADHETWQKQLSVAEEVVRQARLRRDPRQAVILIHGIGEQLPGTTVRSFARAALGLANGDPNEGVLLLKPDTRLEPRHEIFRLQAFKRAETGFPRTDFLELYWQDLIRDTSWKQVWRWAFSVARGDLPPKLAALRRLIRATLALLLLGVLVIGVLLLLGLAEVHWPSWLRTGSTVVTVVSLVGSLVTGLIAGWAVSSLGDAARYLQPLPDNVAARRAIRERGLALLRSLHDSGQYHRVVLVGHSLGSVIGLDILCEFWWERYQRAITPDSRHLPAYRAALDAHQRAAESLQAGGRGDPGARYRNAQRELWKTMRLAGIDWLVSDFVTLGSPLQYPWPFAATDRSDFEQRIEEMVIPTAPPRPEPGQGIAFEASIVGPHGSVQVPVLNQAALFAPVRWTNVAFPCRWWVFGDPVGGPVSEWFGSGVLDRRPTPIGKSWLSRHSPKVHSQYWTHRQPEALSMLDEALELSMLESLEEVARELPLSRFLPTEVELVTAGPSETWG
jgi:hypothetical protein